MNIKKKNDRKRQQCDLILDSKYIIDFINDINTFLNSINPYLEIQPYVIIKSLSGCQEQAAHIDYILNDELKNTSQDKMPLAVIIALQNNTKINVWPGSILLHKYKGPPIKKTILTLNKGDIFLFRGDLVHAGASYEDENIRLHTYLDSPDVSRQHNTTYIIQKHGTQDIINKIDVSL